MVAPQSIKDSPRDVWGSLKVPSYNSMGGSTYFMTRPNTSTWLDVTSGSNFSSLIGVPIAGIPETRQFALNFTTGYFEFHVTGFDFYSNKTLNFTDVNSLLPPLTFPWEIDSNHSNSAYVFGNNATNTETDWFLDTATPFATKPVAPYRPRSVDFGARLSNPTSIGLIHLAVTFVMVDLQCECDGGECTAAKIRVSNQAYNSSGSTLMDYDLTPLDDQNVTERTFQDLPLIDGNAATRTSVNYLQDNVPSESAVSSDDSARGIDIRLWEDDMEGFAQRFSVIFNTYWLSAVAPWQGGQLPSINALESNNPIFASEATTGLATTLEEVYVCNWGWFMLVVGASTITFCCGILNAILRYQSLAPDILGYVSSLTRDNPYCEVPGGGSLLDGIDRARLLKDTKVRLEDVQPQKDVGHIAFARSNGDKFGAGRLRWRRMYD